SGLLDKLRIISELTIMVLYEVKSLTINIGSELSVSIKELLPKGLVPLNLWIISWPVFGGALVFFVQEVLELVVQGSQDASYAAKSIRLGLTRLQLPTDLRGVRRHLQDALIRCSDFR